jgi:hypothetical protein
MPVATSQHLVFEYSRRICMRMVKPVLDVTQTELQMHINISVPAISLLCQSFSI